jgi:Coenzyme PQQ synthesis protein D (PqqD)
MDPFRPQQRPNLIARVVCGEVVVLDPEKRLIHEFNTTASFIWNLCRGRADPSTIAAELSDAYHVDLESATRDVTSTLAQLDKLGLLAISVTSDSVPTESPPVDLP